jgi:hypothetical protein
LGEGLGGVEVVVRVFLGVLDGFYIELRFDEGEALEAPLGGGHIVDQVALDGAVGVKFVEVGVEELMEFFGVLRGQKEVLGGEAVLQCILGRALAAGFGLGAMRFCAVGAGGFGFAGRRHLGHLGGLE